jgi:hypothetical protein
VEDSDAFLKARYAGVFTALEIAYNNGEGFFRRLMEEKRCEKVLQDASARNGRLGALDPLHSVHVGGGEDPGWSCIFEGAEFRLCSLLMSASQMMLGLAISPFGRSTNYKVNYCITL